MAVTFGKYQLERWLARGGMANIFTATYAGPLGFQRDVALKVILPEYAHNGEFISMFLDEARLAARLNHPNIVQVSDLGQVGDYFYIAMEYVAGQSLFRILKEARQQGRKLSPGLAIFLLTSLLEALHYAHERRDRSGLPLGIVHRDVSPQNTLISFDGQVKLADFGVAKANSNLHETNVGSVKGKFSHMAPEQCLAREVDSRADIFAAGIMLHEMLTGQQLFYRSSTFEMMKALLEERIPAPSEINPRSPRELDGVVLRALARDPDARFRSARSFLDRLHLVANQLKIREGNYELRAFLSSLYRLNRINLAVGPDTGVAVSEERISAILRGARFPTPAPSSRSEPQRKDSGRHDSASLPSDVELSLESPLELEPYESPEEPLVLRQEAMVDARVERSEELSPDSLELLEEFEEITDLEEIQEFEEIEELDEVEELDEIELADEDDDLFSDDFFDMDDEGSKPVEPDDFSRPSSSLSRQLLAFSSDMEHARPREAPMLRVEDFAEELGLFDRARKRSIEVEDQVLLELLSPGRALQ